MSIAAHELFKALAGRLIYTNVNRPAELLDLETGLKETCSHRLTIKEFLAGYGFESRKSDQKIEEAEERARRWWDCARQIAEDATSSDLLGLERKEYEKAKEEGWALEQGRLRAPSELVRGSLAQTFALSQDLCGKIDKYTAKFLGGEWLDVFFWGLIDRHRDSLKIWDVRLGLQVGRRGDDPGNELDVAFMHNHGLAMIECKTGGQEQDRSGNDALYKVEAVKRQFGAIRVQSILATTSDNILDPNGSLKATFQNRAALYNCRILSRADIRGLGKEADSPEAVRRTLFGAVGEP